MKLVISRTNRGDPLFRLSRLVPWRNDQYLIVIPGLAIIFYL